jgi:hypothetical protein
MSNKGVLILLVVLVIIFGIILTCPNKADHKAAIVEKVTNVLKTDTVTNGIFSFVTNAVVTKVVGTAADNLLSVDNYFIFSLGTIRYNGEKRVVSIGILHHVFCLFREKDLEDMIEKNIGNIISPE